MTLLETCNALLNNPIEVLDRNHPNFKGHANSLKLLQLKGVIGYLNGEYILTKDDLIEFINNGLLTRAEKLEQDRDIREKETLAISKKSAYYSKLALIISILALFCTIIPLFRNQ